MDPIPAEPPRTMSGIPLDAVYGGDPLPGTFPYTRGIHPGMYRTRRWTMRMFAGMGAAADTNRRFRELLAAGGVRRCSAATRSPAPVSPRSSRRSTTTRVHLAATGLLAEWRRRRDLLEVSALVDAHLAALRDVAVASPAGREALDALRDGGVCPDEAARRVIAAMPAPGGSLSGGPGRAR